jgi:hypothetical protein
MPVKCRVFGCVHTSASRYAVHCSKHVSHARRHGHAEQRGVSACDLNLYRRAVRVRLQRNAHTEEPVLPVLEAEWHALIGFYQEQIDERGRGVRSVQHRRWACQELVRVSRGAEARDVIETVLALYVMRTREPKRFVSDRAFCFQLVRHVRRLGRTRAGVHAETLFYRELPPRTVEAMGKMLIQAFGSAGVHLAKLENEEGEKRRQRANALHSALTQFN